MYPFGLGVATAASGFYKKEHAGTMREHRRYKQQVITKETAMVSNVQRLIAIQVRADEVRGYATAAMVAWEQGKKDIAAAYLKECRATHPRWTRWFWLNFKKARR